MKTALFCIALSIGFIITPVIAQENPKRALAEKLLTVMQIQKTIEGSFTAVTKMLPAQAQTPEAKNMIDLIMKELSWENLKDDYVNLYAEVFTEEELKGLIAFYETPVGQAYAQKQPELTRRSMVLTQQHMVKLVPKLQALPR